MATTGLTLGLGVATCYLVLKLRPRSVLWLALATTRPVGWMYSAKLADGSPAPDDLYQQFIRNLKLYWRILLEIAVFVSAWVLAYEWRSAQARTVDSIGILVDWNSRRDGRCSTECIQRHVRIWRRVGSDLLSPLLYLLWPIFFNLVGRCFKR